MTCLLAILHAFWQHLLSIKLVLVKTVIQQEQQEYYDCRYRSTETFEKSHFVVGFLRPEKQFVVNSL